MGWSGRIVHLRGRIFTSVAPEVINASTELVEVVTHSLCVVRDDKNNPFKVLSPCGVCQERLWFWGDEVQAAVSSNGGLASKCLKELQHYHWSRVYAPRD
jgi:cytidine deaminase